jgi:hypothetical protein
VELVGGDADLRAEAELAPIGEAASNPSSVSAIQQLPKSPDV